MLRRNVLIFHLGALGDFVLTWPLAIALGRIYAQSRIFYVTHGQKGALAEKAARVDFNDVENGWHNLFAVEGTLPPAANKLLTEAHAIYSFLEPTPAWLANVARINPQVKIVALDPRPSEGFSAHVSDWLLEQLKNAPAEQAAVQQILRSIAQRGIGFTRPETKRIVIHPGSGGAKKCWPLDDFAELARRLKKAGRQVVFLTGEVEQERLSAGQLHSLADIAEVRQPQSYVDLLNELSTAGVFIGNDSGPGHLAGIIGVPTISIFTGSDSQRWKPLGPNVRVAEPGSDVDDVLKLIL